MRFQADRIVWETPAGRRLDAFTRALPKGPRLEINIFGSASIQLLVEPGFTSADIGLFGDSEDLCDDLSQHVEVLGWSQEQASDFYI